MADLILLTSLLASCYMTGLIWFVQLVHYAQFDGVGADGWPAYHARHTRSTGMVVAPVMLLELVTAGALLVVRPAEMPASWAVVSFSFVLVLWASTGFIQIPAHHALSHAFDATYCRRLNITNWLRTVVWSARTLLLAVAVLRVMRDTVSS